MFEPRYTITPKLLSNVKRVAVLSSELNRRPLSQVVLLELENRATTLSAHTSTRIEGNPLPLTEVKRLLKTTPRNLRDSEREVVNYNETLITLNRTLREGTPAFSLKLILAIHRGLMNGLLAPPFCGRLRAEPVVVNDPRSGETLYLPPDHKDVSQLMADLVAFIVENRDLLDPLILAGLSHKQFVIIHPFLDGNGRTTRLTTKVLLAALGIDTFPLFSFENYYNRNVSRYFQEVGSIGNYYEMKGTLDFTEWLEYFTDGIIDELLRVSGELESFSASPNTTLKPHHRLILDYIKEHGFITDQGYATLTERAKATRALDFRRLIELGLIERFGKGRGTHYKAKA